MTIKVSFSGFDFSFLYKSSVSVLRIYFLFDGSNPFLEIHAIMLASQWTFKSTAKFFEMKCSSLTKGQSLDSMNIVTLAD